MILGLLVFFVLFCFCLESVYTQEGRRWGLKSWTEETWNIFVAENSPIAIWAMTTFDPNQYNPLVFWGYIHLRNCGQWRLRWCYRLNGLFSTFSIRTARLPESVREMSLCTSSGKRSRTKRITEIEPKHWDEANNWCRGGCSDQESRETPIFFVKDFKPHPTPVSDVFCTNINYQK